MNLIDTPVSLDWISLFSLTDRIAAQGHVDFAWEVSRSLAACQGALLLVDASQGVQAQTISVFHVARDRGLLIIPVLNKVHCFVALVACYTGRLTAVPQIDLPAAHPEEVAAQMGSTFNIDPSEIIQVSAKTGKNVDLILQAIINRVPPPADNNSSPFSALLFDSSWVSGVTLVSGSSNVFLSKVRPLPWCHILDQCQVWRSMQRQVTGRPASAPGDNC